MRLIKLYKINLIQHKYFWKFIDREGLLVSIRRLGMLNPPMMNDLLNLKWTNLLNDDCIGGNILGGFQVRAVYLLIGHLNEMLGNYMIGWQSNKIEIIKWATWILPNSHGTALTFLSVRSKANEIRQEPISVRFIGCRWILHAGSNQSNGLGLKVSNTSEMWILSSGIVLKIRE